MLWDSLALSLLLAVAAARPANRRLIARRKRHAIVYKLYRHH